LFITVLICSRDRAPTFRRTLQSILSEPNLTQANWDLLAVVDRDSGDGAAGVCSEFQQKFPERFRFLVQNESGKSSALNLGIAAARGDVLAMTDDDVVCAADYIRGIQSVFGIPGVDGAQGRVLLDCEGGLPGWMSEALVKFMSLRDYGDQMREWTQTLSGTNMVVRTEAARRVGGFAPELGPGGAGFAEDTEFSLRLLRAGCRLVYAPQIAVRHQLTKKRLTKSFFRQRYFGLGRSHAYYSPMPVPLWRFGLYVAKHWSLAKTKAFWYTATGRPAKALECECEALEQAGFFSEHWRFHRGTRRELSRVRSWPPPVHQASD